MKCILLWQYGYTNQLKSNYFVLGAGSSTGFGSTAPMTCRAPVTPTAGSAGTGSWTHLASTPIALRAPVMGTAGAGFIAGLTATLGLKHTC